MDEPSVLAILPPLLALALAILTRNVLVSLGVGVLLGMTIVNDFNPALGLMDFFERGVFAQLSSASNAQVVIIIMVIGGFVHLMDRSGGMRSFARRMARIVDTPAKTQLSVWVSGLVIFFTDSGNALILGPTFRPIFAGAKICREKLAFIIDSTSSPICVLIPIISWGVYIMSLIERSFEPLGVQQTPMNAWLAALPYQLYPILALLTVPVLAFVGREYGPMWKAQKKYLESQDKIESVDEGGGKDASARAVLLPLVTMLLMLLGLVAYFVATYGELPGSKIRLSLMMAYLSAAAVCAAILQRQKIFKFSESFKIFREGMGKMVMIVVILILAWSLGEVCELLSTGAYIAQFFDHTLPPGLIPPLVFVLGAVFALSTGSSWGTFALMMPIALPVAHEAGISLPVTIAAVLSGGVFGDHCSPVSDTTILSSMSTGCDHASHVNTQLGYAAVTGFSALTGFLIVGFTGFEHVLWPVLILQISLTLTLTRFFGKPTVPAHAAPEPPVEDSRGDR